MSVAPSKADRTQLGVKEKEPFIYLNNDPEGVEYKNMNNQTETKKMNTGKIGFLLSLIAPPSIIVPLIIIFIIPFPAAFVLFAIPPILFLLSFVYSIHGLIKKRSRKLATIGLNINALIIVILFFLLITLTPSGSMPYPLNFYKCRRTCPKADFWLSFDKEHIKEVKSQNVFFVLGSVGTVHFTSSPNAYTTQQVIQYAEANGWKHHASVPASAFQAFLDADEGDLYDLSGGDLFFWYDIKSIHSLNFLIEKNDTILIFETENYLGVASFAVLSDNKDALRIYYNNPARPDPARDFSLPESFQEYDATNREETK